MTPTIYHLEMAAIHFEKQRNKIKQLKNEIEKKFNIFEVGSPSDPLYAWPHPDDFWPHPDDFWPHPDDFWPQINQFVKMNYLSIQH